MRSTSPHPLPDPPLLGRRALPALAVLLAMAGTSPAGAQDRAERSAPAKDGAHSGLHWHHDLEDALAEAERRGRPVLVDLYADWCGLCKRLEREVFTHDGFREYVEDRFVFLRVDIDDGGQGTLLRDRFARSMPTTVVIEHHMARVGIVRGFHPAPAFITRLEVALERHRELEKTFQRVLREDSPQQLFPLAEALLQRGDGSRAATLYRRLLDHGFDPKDGQIGLRFRLAEALRISRQLTAAEQQVRLIHRYTHLAGNRELQERLAMLEIRIALDRNDCDRATDAVQNFLESHPRSRRTGEALAALRSVEINPEARCQ